MQSLSQNEYVVMHHLFTVEEGRSGAVVTFLALLELVKEGLIDCVQAEPYSNIHVKLKESDFADE